MLKGKEPDKWDRKRSINYVNIPVRLKVGHLEKTTDFKYSTIDNLLIVIVILFMIGSYISSAIENWDNVEYYLLLAILTGGLFITVLIKSSIQIYKDELIIRLTAESLEFKGRVYLWNDIENMYMKVEQDSDSTFFYHLVLETYGEKKELPLQSLDSPPKIIIKEVGKYYGSWKRNQAPHDI